MRDYKRIHNAGVGGSSPPIATNFPSNTVQSVYKPLNSNIFIFSIAPIVPSLSDRIPS
jgi:hypothetical protein